MTSALQPPPYLVPSYLIQMDKWRCSLLYQALINSSQVLTLIQMLIHSVEMIHIDTDIDSSYEFTIHEEEVTKTQNITC